MKTSTFLFLVSLFSFCAQAQVGINTVEPTTTLDVNGSIRVRAMNQGSLSEVLATRIVGVDDYGNFTDIEIGDNIILKNNELSVINRTLKVGNIPPFTTLENHNVDLIIWPGGGNEDVAIMRIVNNFGAGDTEITGIAGGTDGMHIWLFAVSGKIELIPNSPDSDPENRFLPNAIMKATQYEMIELFYDGTLQKWVVMQNHQ